MKNEKIYVVIPAAGSGQRMKSKTPKQYLKLGQQTVLEKTLDAFSSIQSIKAIALVLSEQDMIWPSLSYVSQSRAQVLTVVGGKERVHSVLSGINALIAQGACGHDWVMVHDAARPFVCQEDIASLIQLCIGHRTGGILALPAQDTLKASHLDPETSQPFVTETKDRSNLWHALTPQLFPLGQLKCAIHQCLEQGLIVTDEASAVEQLGAAVLLCPATYPNLKITTPADWVLAQALYHQEHKVKGK